jgi:hypothetical protein
MSVFQALSAGNIGHPPTRGLLPGTGAGMPGPGTGCGAAGAVTRTARGFAQRLRRHGRTV